jgi:hypothetical protein
MDSLDKILVNNKHIFNPNKKNKILFATGFAGYNHGAIVDKIISISLSLRDCAVEFFICDEFLPTCMLTKIKQIQPKDLSLINKQPRCNDCFNNGQKYFKHLDFKKKLFSNFVSEEKKELINNICNNINFKNALNYKINNVKIGEEAYAGCLRYYGREEISREEYKLEILRKFLKSALLTYYSFNKLLDEKKYDCVVYSHGIYVPHGIINQILKNKNIRSVVYIPSYRKNTFIFSHNDTYHRTMIDEENIKWKNIKFEEREKKILKDYLFSRRHGTNDWITFNTDNEYDYDLISKKNNIKKNKKTILLLTSVIWDARLHYSSNAFPSMIDWIIETIKYYEKKNDIQLIVRIHPAEITGDVPSRQKVEEEILERISQLPENIILIKPDNPASTYTLIENSNLILIYNTKTGIEAAASGKKIVVAGEAWIRNKGFSLDASNKEDYFKILNDVELDKNLSNENLIFAQKYAYHVFFRRMIELKQLSINYLKKNKFTVNVSTISELMPGLSIELDTICNGIIYGTDFIYDDKNQKINNIKTNKNFRHFFNLYAKKILSFLR